ncbi:MAG: hypothetical protein H3C62_06630, partial [Gemmatimonadaceae bacterium]|nr:hypothetical protein [Gemmatimonadaceae bacterium]
SGYPSDAPLVRVSDGDAPQHVALVIFAGLPAPAAFERAMAAQPGRAVALISPRQLGALRKMAGAGSVTPYTTRRATSAARAQEERMRGELRSVLATAYPSHEIMALEPLLAEFDGVELAGAALRLLDAARASAATPAVVAPAATAAAARSPRPARTAHDDRPARDAREPRGDRPARPREGFPLREPGPGEKPRFVDRTVRRDADRAPRRSFGDGPKRSYGDGPKRSYGDGPKRSYGDGPKRSFGDRPRGAQGDKPRGRFGDKPRGAGPRRPRGE